MIVNLVLFHVVTIILYIGIVYIAGLTQHISSILIGSLVIGSNLVLLVISIYGIFVKKLIALAVSVIVFKYAILIGIIYFLITKELVNGLWFGIGISTLFPTLIMFGAKYRKFDFSEVKGRS